MHFQSIDDHMNNLKNLAVCFLQIVSDEWSSIAQCTEAIESRSIMDLLICVVWVASH